MDYQELINYMTKNADETYGENGDTTHYLGLMPLYFQYFDDFKLLKNDNYIDEINEEGIIYDYHEF